MDLNPRNLSPAMLNIVRYTTLGIIIPLIISDYFLWYEFQMSSSYLTVRLQAIGGDTVAFLCKLLSGPLTYGAGAFIITMVLVPNTRKQLVYHILLLMSIISIDFLLKIVYGRIRPFLINPDIKTYSCPCDYGMPSGHSGNAVVIYYIINQYLAAYYEAKVVKTESDQKWRLAITFLCIFIGLVIPLNRIYLGVHSWN